MKALLTFLVLLWAGWAWASPADLQRFDGARFIPTPWADGDSFMVELGPGMEVVLRLYFVDCKETSASTETDQRRVRDQSSYFGIDDHRTTMRFGRLAAEKVAAWLAEPFTVHTAFARAPGRSAKPRYYGFVTLADGRDLGEVLVAEGLARSFGVRRSTPEGLSSDLAKAQMDDLELGAAIARQGIWSETSPELLVAMRGQRREEERRLQEAFGLQPGTQFDLNEVTVDELVLLPGVGPVLAERIVDGRPYASVQDLRRVPGVGTATFERLKDSLIVDP
jgi:competence protein ComEA